MIDSRTVAELEAAGWSYIDVVCAACGRTMGMPFRLLRMREKIDDKTTVAEMRRRYVCKGCGSKSVETLRAMEAGQR